MYFSDYVLLAYHRRGGDVPSLQRALQQGGQSTRWMNLYTFERKEESDESLIVSFEPLAIEKGLLVHPC